jgi:serine/threonine protein kinase
LIKKDVDSDSSDAYIARQLLRNRKGVGPNIIEIRATIKIGALTSILLECAEGTLHELMEEKIEVNGTRFLNGTLFDHKLKLIQKFLDVGRDGLHLLHNEIEYRDTRERTSGVHVDFGPRNILVVKTGNRGFTLKIADFGNSFLQCVETTQNGAKNLRQGEQCDCLSPEGLEAIHEEIRRNMNVTWSYDVFAFACAFCMFLAWLWDGKRGYEAFRKSRKLPLSELTGEPQNYRFFEVYERVQNSCKGDYNTMLWTEVGDVPVTIKVNSGVVRYFQSVRDGEDRPRERSLYWNLFSTLLEVALVPHPEKRLTITEVCKRLEQVISAAKTFLQSDEGSSKGQFRKWLSSVLAKMKGCR